MAQTQEVRGVKTAIITEDGRTKVIYRGTVVVAFTADTIWLRSGGYESATTKTRMTQASNQYGLKFGVYQKDYKWFVTTPDGRTLPFEDGMSFARA